MRLPKPDKPMPVEERLEKILSVLISDRINLYLDLKKVLGEKEGVAVYKKLYDEGMKRIRKNFPGGKLPVGELMKRELVSFPMLGFELYIDHEVENGEDVYYEHLTKCPFLDMAKKMGIAELPCDFICSYDVEVALRDKRGRWEIISRMG
ncbi:MAG: L-2-amino-thiazoline-4-carboxylic acid hydrolase, partial [Desulfobacterota bacterium]|nr:L-2-amino-thiazoline-4-carboxylic acid hydrolase [Thermodesulfobacteriota bacterium]